MLLLFNSMNDSFHEVNVTPRTTMYRLVSIELLRQLMRRTGTGAPVTTRQLALDAGIAHGTVGNLLTGHQDAVLETTAKALAQRLGVDLLVLFEPVCRSTTGVRAWVALVQSAEEATA